MVSNSNFPESLKKKCQFQKAIGIILHRLYRYFIIGIEESFCYDIYRKSNNLFFFVCLLIKYDTEKGL